MVKHTEVCFSSVDLYLPMSFLRFCLVFALDRSLIVDCCPRPTWASLPPSWLLSSCQSHMSSRTSALSVLWLFLIERLFPVWRSEFSWRGPIIIHLRLSGITGHISYNRKNDHKNTIIIIIIYEILSVESLGQLFPIFHNCIFRLSSNHTIPPHNLCCTQLLDKSAQFLRYGDKFMVPVSPHQKMISISRVQDEGNACLHMRLVHLRSGACHGL